MKRLLTFASIHYVLKAEKILKAQGMIFEVIPVPKEISSDCGMALLIEKNDSSRVQNILKEKGLSPQGIYPYDRPTLKDILKRQDD